MATPWTTPTSTYTMLSTLVAMQEQSSSTKEKIMKKSKPTARHPASNYPTTTGTTRGSDAATKQYHLLNRPSSRRSILLTRNSIQNASCTPKESTRASNASSFAKHSMDFRNGRPTPEASEAFVAQTKVKKPSKAPDKRLQKHSNACRTRL